MCEDRTCHGSDPRGRGQGSGVYLAQEGEDSRGVGGTQLEEEWAHGNLEGEGWKHSGLAMDMRSIDGSGMALGDCLVEMRSTLGEHNVHEEGVRGGG